MILRIKVVNRQTGEASWPYAPGEYREIASEWRGDIEAYLKSLGAHQAYPQDQYEIYWGYGYGKQEELTNYSLATLD